MARVATRHDARRPLGLSLILFAATVAGGLVIRFAPLGLPTVVVKYGGSTLWAMMIYWIVSTLRPANPPYRAACVAGVLAAGIEAFKLYHAPALDRFRLTLAGALLLGRFFSLWDILAYTLAISAGACLDHAIHCRLAYSLPESSAANVSRTSR